MAFKTITYRGKPISVHKAIMHPDFNSKTVLVSDTWDYVAMWLKRNHKKEAASFCWQQAKYFFIASAQLPKTSSPLTTYYCFLNAVKTLLLVRGLAIPDRHGVTGQANQRRASLSNEFVKFQSGGILAQLCEYLGEPTQNEQYTIKDILYNLPYIHRAYTLTYESSPELYTPVENCQFVKKVGSEESWFCAEVSDKRYANQHLINKLPADYEQDTGVTDRFIIRRHRRFNWTHGRENLMANLRRLSNYHRAVRKQLYYIQGSTRLWYIKRDDSVSGVINRSSLTLTFAAMHRLSEIARYAPTLLAKHFDCHHNWLLSEFITTAPYQFIDHISAEITGQEFMTPGRR